MLAVVSLALIAILPRVSGHSAFWHPSMFGFNVTDKTFPYDNRPVAPIKNMNFTEWWFHNHLDFPPNDGDIFELPAGKPATAQIACNKGATDFFASADGGDIREPNNMNDPCPNSPTTAYHTNGFDDLKGCSLAIAYKNDARAVQPEDFTVFSVNHTCVWTRFTDFQVPARMPPCPEGGCICAFFWIHSPLSGGEENYMNGFKCNVTGSTSNSAVAKSKLPRRCGSDLPNQKLQDVPANCTYGAKQPFYWFNNELNNMFEGTFSPPVYNDLYNFADGAQDDIFIDSYTQLPDPAPNAALPIVADIAANLPMPSININITSPLSQSAPYGVDDDNSTTTSASSSGSSSYIAKPVMSDSHVTANIHLRRRMNRSRLDIHRRNKRNIVW
ncbi:hypothetical protein CVT25_006991 [Psilocybe cyanescens]|uniref:Chitin-binding type-4 domain-containing protein n=1 Tax=Psilocybe cyanescens TaxID=93625 RepID=A0A409WYF8_PSICY|nr:hypothetical protein CVT25_006991 [Psilocybe cyanescens]